MALTKPYLFSAEVPQPSSQVTVKLPKEYGPAVLDESKMPTQAPLPICCFCRDKEALCRVNTLEACWACAADRMPYAEVKRL